MRCHVHETQLADAISSVLRILPERKLTRGKNQVVLDVTATVLSVSLAEDDIYVRCTIPAARTISGSASIIGDALLKDLGKAKTPFVELSREGGQLTVSAGSHRRTLAATDAAVVFPIFAPLYRGACSLVDIQTMFQKVEFCVSRDVTRPALTGVCWELEKRDQGTAELSWMVATNGHQLGLVRRATAAKSDLQIVLSPGTLRPLPLSAEAAQFEFNGDYFALKCSGFRVASKLISTSYVDYRKVIPPLPRNHVVVGREALSDSLRRCIAFSSPVNWAVRLDLSSEVVTLRMEIDDVGSCREELGDAQYAGDYASVRFVPAHLLSILDHISETKVVLDVGTEKDAILIKADPGSDFLYLAMPVTVDKTSSPPSPPVPEGPI